jgi:nicotinamidase-related amidase
MQIAGASPTPARLAEATIVVIDAQREYVDGLLRLNGVDPALEEIGRLLARARAAGTPIILIVHLGRVGGAFAPGSRGAETVLRA